MQHRTIGIGLAGLGTVGAGVYKHLQASAGELLTKRSGYTYAVRQIVVRDPHRQRPVSIDNSLLSTEWRALIERDDIDVVVELIGGTSDAYEIIAAALRAGKAVVTGNKALLAEKGAELFALAREKRVPLLYEAAVAGGIPIIKTVKEALIANRIDSLYGIINGTSNFILSRMEEEEGLSFDSALEEAKSKGYAEADPTLDINGWDAAHKAIILAALAYGKWVEPDQILVEGIDAIEPEDIQFAAKLGYQIKLLGIVKAQIEGEVEVRVHPTLIPSAHILSSVRGVNNALVLHGDIVGETLYYGPGAGMDPTASAVIADIAQAATLLDSPQSQNALPLPCLHEEAQAIDSTISGYYLRIQVSDEPGVLGRIAQIVGQHAISIASVFQPEQHRDHAAQLILMTQPAPWGQMAAALGAIAALDCTQKAPKLLRVEHP